MAKENIVSNSIQQKIGVGNTTLLDTAMIKLSEFGVDEASGRLGFNGTFLTGGTKIVTAYGLSYLLPKGIVQNVNSGLMADGITDMYTRGKKMLFGDKKKNSNNGGSNTVLRTV